MKKLQLFFIFLITPIILFATIDECKTDIYFANGILTSPDGAKKSATLLRTTVIKKYGLDYFKQHIGKVDYAYNTTLDRSKDMYEAYMQLSEEDPDFIPKLKIFWAQFFSDIVVESIEPEIADAKVYETMIKEVHDADLQKQIESYKTSIDSGHGVVVVAHSQGTLFTNEAYSALTSGDQNSWRKDFFEAFYVAPASTKVLEDNKNTPAFVFDNDPISRLATHFGFHETINPNKYTKESIGMYGGTSYSYSDNEVFHYFSYYMGKPLTYTDDVGEHTVSTDLAKTEILNFIENSILAHDSTPSQWQTDQELNKDTKDYRITVKHKFDPSITEMDGVEVFPFAPSKKLYYVDGNISGYVKASCGGTQIFDTWDNQQSGEIYLINNPEEEIIFNASCLHGYYFNKQNNKCEWILFKIHVDPNLYSNTKLARVELNLPSEIQKNASIVPIDFYKADYYYNTSSSTCARAHVNNYSGGNNFTMQTTSWSSFQASNTRLIVEFLLTITIDGIDYTATTAVEANRGNDNCD
jgi:hypothetical protein